MAKIDFSKVEKSFDAAVEKLMIEHLADLASVESAIQDPSTAISNKTIENIIGRFQKQLKKIKKNDPKLYERLAITEEEEKRFFQSPQEYLQKDWVRLRDVKTKLEEYKFELHGEEGFEAENEEQIKKERKKHVNKRFNVRDGWLPLK